MEHEIIKRLEKTKDYSQVYKIPRDIFLGKTDFDPKGLRVGFVVNTCFGFGDVIFTFKLLTYFKRWYGINPIVFTTTPDSFSTLIPNNQIKRLAVPGMSLDETCDYPILGKLGRVVAYDFDTHRKRYKPKHKLDAIFVTPWVGDNHTVNHNALKNIFPESNKFNTFIFSAYNRVKRGDPFSKFDFELGLGDHKLGLLYYPESKCGERPKNIKNPYIISYIGDIPEVDALGCFVKFVKKVVFKYSDIYDRLEILIPKSIITDIRFDRLSRYIEKMYSYDVLVCKSSDDTRKIYQRKKDQDRYLLFRADLGSVPYLEYLDYICNALPDILVTGNQSVSDILRCCPDFNIHYQTMPWEKNFAKELAIVSGVSDLGIPSKSCAHNGNTRLSGTAEKSDLEKKGKKHIDAVLSSVYHIKTDPLFGIFVDLALKSRKIDTLLSKLTF
jgi:hypothetical protein